MRTALRLAGLVLIVAVAVGVVILRTADDPAYNASGEDVVTKAAPVVHFDHDTPRDDPLPRVTAAPVTVPPPPPPPPPPTTVRPRAVAPAPPRPRPPAAAPVAGAEAFRQCVFLRESGRNYHVGFAGGYGILTATWHSLGYSGTAGAADPATQDAAFWALYAKYGTSPWAPYDGC